MAQKEMYYIVSISMRNVLWGHVEGGWCDKWMVAMCICVCQALFDWEVKVPRESAGWDSSKFFF